MKYLIALLSAAALMAFAPSLQAQPSEGDPQFDPAFAHAVYFWLHHPDDPEDRQEFEAALRTLLARSRFTKTNFVGRPPKATREVVDDSFTYAMIVTFESAEAQEAYQEEQAHLDFIARAGHLWKKVLVYDAEGMNP